LVLLLTVVYNGDYVFQQWTLSQLNIEFLDHNIPHACGGKTLSDFLSHMLRASGRLHILCQQFDQL